jgi:hypothetical protein
MKSVEIHSWIAADTADNAAATATKAAPSGGISHYITSVSASFDASVSGAQLILKHGTTEMARWYVYDAFALVFPSAIQLPPGTAANLELAASGTAGTTGAVNLSGYTL